MDKKALEAIVEMAKAAGADVKVVEIKGNESEEGNKETLPTIPLLKFEVGLEKMMVNYLLKQSLVIINLANFSFK